MGGLTRARRAESEHDGDGAELARRHRGPISPAASASAPAWANLLSQPGEAGERVADDVATSVVAGAPVQRGPQPLRDHLPADAPPAIAAEANRGRPLRGDDRAFFEGRLGTGLGHVRVHDGDSAAAIADAADARAVTVGSHVFLNRGEGGPGPGGRGLLSHELAHATAPLGPTRLWRQPKGVVTDGEPIIGGPLPAPEPERIVRLNVEARGMDEAAQLLAKALGGLDKRNEVYIGLHPSFVKVYDVDGKAISPKLPLKPNHGYRFVPGVYVQAKDGLAALTVSSHRPDRLGLELDAEGKERSTLAQKPRTAEEIKAIEEELAKAKAEKREPKLPALEPIDVPDLLVDPSGIKQAAEKVPSPRIAIYFVPTYIVPSSSGGKPGDGQGLFASPVPGRGDGEPANAPGWPVTVDGPKLVPRDSSPTFSAKVDWAANGNYSLASQVISQVGETIHYRWELFDITAHAKKQAAATLAKAKAAAAAAKAPPGTAPAPAKDDGPTLEQKVDELKGSAVGTGTDVTGMDAGNREFRREFENWWKDSAKAAKGSVDPSGDTVGERLSNAAANKIALELTPVSLLVTAVGATLRWFAELFAGPRKEQEINLETEGIFLVRVITTPAVQEDREGKRVVRPPSVAAKVVEVAKMEKAVEEALDEPGAQLAQLEADIAAAEAAGNASRAAYLKGLLAEAKLRFEGSPIDLLRKERAKKQAELEEHRKKTPSLSDYAKAHAVEVLDDQIALYQKHESVRTGSDASLGAAKRLNATLISEVTGLQYPLLLAAGPMAKDGDKYRWMVIDITNRDGERYTGLGDTPGAALESALHKFGGKAAYGRGRIGVKTEGLGIEGAKRVIFVESAPMDWALAEKRIDDLVMTLVVLGLFVASAGTASAVIGAGVAAARLIKRWENGSLRLDDALASDVLGILGGVGAVGQVVAGLRVQKMTKDVWALTKEGAVADAQLAKAVTALNAAQDVAKGVELANEALNYAGLVWGNVTFLDQMLSIAQQEANGEITSAAARRARASALAGAIQNNGMFLAGNVIKAKQRAKGAEAEPSPKQQAAPKEQSAPKDQPGEAQPSEQAPKKDSAPAVETPAPKQQKVPIGERQATIEELRSKLPPDQRALVKIDPTLEGDTVKVDYDLDPKTDLIREIVIRVSPDARPGTVGLHADTVRAMQGFQGFAGRVRQALSYVADIFGIETLDPKKRGKAFEAALEIRKLPKVIKDQVERIKTLDPEARRLAEAELDALEVQLEQHLRTLELAADGDGAGYVAAKGLSKAKQKQYADLKEQLRKHEKGSKRHRELRWEMYQLVGGELPYDTWSKVYEKNVAKATKANEIVKAEHERLGWGKSEVTLDVDGEERRLDIADRRGRRGIEVKAYESGYITASEEIVSEVNRDAKLVKRGWRIKWVLIDTEPSGPLLEKLLKAGITVEIRVRKPGALDADIVTHLKGAGARIVDEETKK